MAATISNSGVADSKDSLSSRQHSQVPAPSTPISKSKSNLNIDTHSANIGCRSVKSIVAWIESSTAGSRVSFASTPSQRSGMSTFTNPASNFERTISQKSLLPDGEEESLTFLAYRNYFTNTSLIQCLEEYPEPFDTLEDMSKQTHITSRKPTTPQKLVEKPLGSIEREDEEDNRTRTKEDVVAF